MLVGGAVKSDEPCSAWDCHVIDGRGKLTKVGIAAIAYVSILYVL